MPKASGKAVKQSVSAEPEPKPAPVEKQPEPEKADPSEITRQIELNLSKILDGTTNAPAASGDVSGDTMVMKPLG